MRSARRSRSEVVIGLDLATKCGWAVLKGGRRVASGRWNLLGHDQPRALRWLRLEEELTKLIAKYQPSVVAFERVRRHVGTTAAHVYGGLLASLERVEYALKGTPAFVGLEVSAWRKVACGKGNADKKLIETWAKIRFKHVSKTTDEAEALGIAEAMSKMLADKSLEVGT